MRMQMCDINKISIKGEINIKMRRKDFLFRLMELSQRNEEYLTTRDGPHSPQKSKLKSINMAACLSNIHPPAQYVINQRFNRRVLILTKPRQRQQVSRPQSVSNAKPVSATQPIANPPFDQSKQQLLRSNFLLEEAQRDSLLLNKKEASNYRHRSTENNKRKPQPNNDTVQRQDSAIFKPEPMNSKVQTKDTPTIMIEAAKQYRSSTNHVSFLTRQKQIQEQRIAKINFRKEINKNYARPFVPPPKISAKSYVVYEISEDANKSRAIVSFNSKNAQEIASLTKIMTCTVVLDACALHRLQINEQMVKIGRFQSNIGGTSANIQAGQVYSVQQLLYGLMLPSGNDASLALAVWAGRLLLTRDCSQTVSKQSSIDSSVNTNRESNVNLKECITRDNVNERMSKSECYNRFIVAMNEKAKELKMTKTHYANSHGLANTDNKSCAYDTAILSEYALRNEEFKRIVRCRVYQTKVKTGETEEKEVVWENTHRLLQSRPEEYIGVKTGYTTAAGPCLCSCFVTSTRKFLVIVLGCCKPLLRFRETEVLRKWLYKVENIPLIVRKQKGTISLGQILQEEIQQEDSFLVQQQND